jgi:dTDP-glucose pyrophosphorylase
MNKIRDQILKEDSSIEQAIKVLNRTEMVIVVNEVGKLLGTITDKDIRNALLKKVNINTKITKIMNSSPTYLVEPIDTKELRKTKKKSKYSFYPVVDSNKIITNIYSLDKVQKIDNDHVVFIMAGGLGKRLGPITTNLPKPMLKVGTKPVLQTIVENYKRHNFKKFLISVNHLADIIKNYFQDGSLFGVEINYIEEKKPLGTAGSLSLMREKPQKPFFVSNGDVLSKVNVSEMLDFHIQNKALITVGMSQYKHQIPYGVFEVEDKGIKSFNEKPIKTFFINAGIYIIDPEVLDIIPKNKFINMTDIINIFMNNSKNVLAFPIHEYWIDIGQLDHLTKAEKEYGEIFI